ncbi:hypothetical protein QCD68_17375, partial [Curtobacterium sp. PsM8]|nr:hypothetical protein [Curtobacterium sp. PsM8]
TQYSTRATPTPTTAAVRFASSAGATTTVAYAEKTDVDRQLQYAMRHWSEYNTAEYGTFNPI